MSDKGHVLYTNQDTNIPIEITDANGQVVLHTCKICQRAEVELEEECTDPTPFEINMAGELWAAQDPDKRFHDAKIKFLVLHWRRYSVLAEFIKLAVGSRPSNAWYSLNAVVTYK